MIVGTRNWLADLLLGTQVNIPTTAPGYSPTSLWRGGTALAWRSATSAAAHTFEFRLTTGRPVDLAAIFDVRASGVAVVQSVALGRKNVWGAGAVTSEGAIALNERGDGARVLPVPVAAETWVLTVTLSAPALLFVGGIWLGKAAQLSRAYATRQDELQYHVIENVSEAKGVRTAELADYTHRFSLGFDRLRDAERDEVLAIVRAVRGSSLPCVLVPDEREPSRAYYGRLRPAINWSVDFPVNTGMGLEFHEDGRALGG